MIIFNKDQKNLTVKNCLALVLQKPAEEGMPSFSTLKVQAVKRFKNSCLSYWMRS